jgi:hypothetical protein
VLWPLVHNGISLLGECHRVRKLGALPFLSLIDLCVPFLSIPFLLAPARLATSMLSPSVKIRVGRIFTKCISMLLLRGLAANPNEDNAININQQDQSGAAEAWWVQTHRSKGSLRIISVGREHLKITTTRAQVKVARVKVQLQEAMKDR